MSENFALQSIVIDDRAIQVSYYLEEDRDDYGVLIRTAAISPPEFGAEIGEVFEAAERLVNEWEANRRQRRVPAPRA